MLKINLLPPHLKERKKRNLAIAVVTLLVAGEVAGVFIASQPLQQRRTELEAQKTDENTRLNKLTTISTNSVALAGKESEIAPKRDFLRGMRDFNKALPDLYEHTAGFTYREATVLNMEASQNQLRFNAYLTSASDISRLMLGLSRSDRFVGLPAISSPPGY
ncbi:MAG: hypothetical protein FJX77_12700, partial [Armatimonadetes bacterium]|nr:hypothetical protein [Armatimonadota bacterium]